MIEKLNAKSQNYSSKPLKIEIKQDIISHNDLINRLEVERSQLATVGYITFGKMKEIIAFEKRIFQQMQGSTMYSLEDCSLLLQCFRGWIFADQRKKQALSYTKTVKTGSEGITQSNVMVQSIQNAFLEITTKEYISSLPSTWNELKFDFIPLAKRKASMKKEGDQTQARKSDEENQDDKPLPKKLKMKLKTKVTQDKTKDVVPKVDKPKIVKQKLMKEQKSKLVCKFWKQGKCREGQACLFKHA